MENVVEEKPKILVVDDEPDVVTFLDRVLRAEGFEIFCAYDGIDALSVAESEDPDLILLDVMMPMMSGYEVCQELRANPKTQSIPIVCVSSAHSPEARALSLKAGASALIVKPFSPAELFAQVRRYIRKSSTAS